MNPGQSRSHERHLVTYFLEDECYGVNIMDVQEIVRIPPLTRVPRAPAFVEGIANLRGNVLPIVSTRRRFGLHDAERTDANRVLVIDVDGKKTGLLVDAVSDVLRVAEDHIEPPPPTIRNGDSEALEGMVKLEGGRRLVMVLNSARLCQVSALEGAIADTTSSAAARQEKRVEKIDEEQLVTFRLGDEEYALDIENVREIIRVPELTRIPKAPAYVEGVISLRDRLLPIVNLRARFGLPAREVNDATRIVVVDTGQLSVGLMVDRVSEVMRIPSSVVDAPPSIIAGADAEQVRGIAKLQKGERLLMLLQASRILSGEELNGLADMSAGKTKGTESMKGDKRSLDEEQLVTFRLGREEFGVRIMQVQEINRLSEITRVPMAPDFVDGVINLRGNVIPVIDLRRRFGLEQAERNESTRIIIVVIQGRHTGLVVDSVSEVLRLDRSLIEQTPAILRSGVAADFMEGIGKLNGGSRMVVLLNLERLLDRREEEALKEMGA